MVTIIDKVDCVGCMACMNVCPKQCIEMTQDEEGFSYPHVDVSKCINCNLCENVCPVKKERVIDSKEPKAFAAYNKNEDIRLKSSSGGIFTLLAENIISRNGVVFGAAFDDDFSAKHISVDYVDDLDKLRGFKYVQSSIGDTYKEALRCLEGGRLVLFTGTPCQIAGLKAFLEKDYENLITQDVICHGVPSPMVWKQYVKYREAKAASKTRRTFSRHKKNGWKMYSVLFEFSNSTEYIQVFDKDLYMSSFLRNLCLRPSCYNCKLKSSNQIADITLADFWGIENVAPEMDDDKGTSLVIIHSEKGASIWNEIREKAENVSVNMQSALAANPSYFESCAEPNERSGFMKDIRSKDFEKVVNKYTTPKKKSLFRRFKNRVKRCFR